MKQYIVYRYRYNTNFDIRKISKSLDNINYVALVDCEDEGIGRAP